MKIPKEQDFLVQFKELNHTSAVFYAECRMRGYSHDVAYQQTWKYSSAIGLLIGESGLPPWESNRRIRLQHEI